MRKIVLLTIFSCAIFALHAQKLEVRVNRDSILIGEPIRLELKALFSAGEPVSWFDLDTLSHFDILDQSEVDTTRENGTLTLSQRLTITSWDSGKLVFPALPLNSSSTRPININVAYEPSPFDTTLPYHEIKPILDVKKEAEPVWQWYLVFALVLLLLFLLFFPKPKKRTSGVFAPDESIYKKSLKALDRLQREAAPDPKATFTDLMQILRTYLQKRKNIESFSQTTDDLGLKLQQLNPDRDVYAGLLQTMRLSDLVKFAKFQPSAAERNEAIDNVRDAIVHLESLAHVV